MLCDERTHKESEENQQCFLPLYSWCNCWQNRTRNGLPWSFPGSSWACARNRRMPSRRGLALIPCTFPSPVEVANQSVRPVPSRSTPPGSQGYAPCVLSSCGRLAGAVLNCASARALFCVAPKRGRLWGDKTSKQSSLFFLVFWLTLSVYRRGSNSPQS